MVALHSSCLFLTQASTSFMVMNGMSTSECLRISEILSEGSRLKSAVFSHPSHLIAAVDIIERAMRFGSKLMLCGNGGSAADAMHLAAEWTIRLRGKVARSSWPALALTLDPVVMSAAGNDFGFEDCFARPLGGLGAKGDVLIGITTSGRSPNVLAALKLAREMGICTIGFLGGDGGPALPLCDHAFVVPSTETARIQEVHIAIGHTILELTEDRLVASPVA